MWVWDAARGTWSTAKRSGRPPSQRSGFTMAADVPRSRLVCFGGVHDEEDPEHESLRSVFFNDLHVYSLEHGKWFAPSERPDAELPGAAERGAGAVVGTAGASERAARVGAGGMDVDSVPGGGAGGSSADAAALAVAKRGESDELADGVADLLLLDTGGKRGRRERRREDGAGEDGASLVFGAGSAHAATASGADCAGAADVAPLPTAPCARMNGASAVRGNVLYLWGGLVERRAAEVTLDDLWALNMSKLDINRPDWTCLWRGAVRAEPEDDAPASSDDESSDDGGPPEGEEGLSTGSSDEGEEGEGESDSEEWAD